MQVVRHVLPSVQLNVLIIGIEAAVSFDTWAQSTVPRLHLIHEAVCIDGDQPELSQSILFWPVIVGCFSLRDEILL